MTHNHHVFRNDKPKKRSNGQVGKQSTSFQLVESCGNRSVNDNDNDNDNDTLREVPHPSNEGLALQARVSGPWPHKKESVLLV